MRAACFGGLVGIVLCSAACGGGGGTDGARDGAPPAIDGSRPDAAPGDGGAQWIDPGSPPACSVSPTAARVSEQPTLQRNEDPAFFGPLDPARERFLFLGKASDAERNISVRALSVPRAAETSEATTVATVAPDEDVPRFTAAFGSEGVLAMWQRQRGSLDMPATYGSSIELLAFDATGAAVGAASTWRDDAASPIVSPAREGYAVLYAEILETMGAVVARPRLQRVSADGEGLGPDAPLTGFIPIEASRVVVRPFGDGLVAVYHLAPSAYVLPMTADGTPDDAARVVREVPGLDDVAAFGSAVALVWTVPRGTDGGTVHVAVVDRSASVRSRIELESFSGEAPPRVAVAPAWPGFAVVWRRGGAGAAAFRAAGIGEDGRVIVPPHELVQAPDAVGRVMLDAQGRELFVGYRDAPVGGTYGYGMARACLRAE